jgi:ribosomal protein S27E
MVTMAGCKHDGGVKDDGHLVWCAICGKTALLSDYNKPNCKHDGGVKDDGFVVWCAICGKTALLSNYNKPNYDD